MRKLFVTLLSACLMAGVLAGTNLPAAAMALPAHGMAGDMAKMVASAPVECPQHGRSQRAPVETPHKQGNLSCCITGQCPMLAQALLPAPTFVRAVPQRLTLLPTTDRDLDGIESGPGLEPPRLSL